MRFVSDRGDEIDSLETWERVAGPVSEVGWKAGRSASELAKDWFHGHGPRRAARLLGLHPDLGEVTFELGTAEKRTRFDEIPHGPRNHDLLVTGAADAGRIVVGVEGKADEPFGESLAAYRDTKRSERSLAPQRLERLTRMLFGTTVADDPTLETIRYQLCSAVAGTLADAKTEGAEAAVLLVHELQTAATADRLHADNASALETFVGRLPNGASKRYVAADGWIEGPWTLRGDGEWLPSAMPTYVAKLTTDLRASQPGL
jgi:hypothetical protein